MTDEEIISIASHAFGRLSTSVHDANTIRFARAIIKLERERCAKICDNYSLRIAMRGCHDWPSAPEVAGDLAEEIREKK